MTNRTTNKQNKRIVVALAATLMACAMSAQTYAHGAEGIRDRYKCQKRDLYKAHLNELKAIRAEYQAVLAQTAAARRGASKLCEPTRTHALHQIKAARSEAGECFRDAMHIEKKSYRLAVAELEAWYASASRHTHAHVAVTTVPVRPTYVVDQTTTYTVQTHPPVETVSPGYELIEPRGPVYEGPVYNGPTFESPVYESPVYSSPIEGSVFPGPVLEGPLNPVPSTGVEFLPTVSAIPARPANLTTVVRTTAARPVNYTTKVVTVTRPAPVQVTPVAVIGHGHDHGRLRTKKAARAAAVGNLVSHALRALAY